MTLQLHAWEHRLLSLAQDPLPVGTPSSPGTLADTALLEQAYDHCLSLTARHSRSFYLASALLPADKRQAVRALYAFCRITDDIVDDGERDASAKLAAWKERTLTPSQSTNDLVALAWADAQQRHQIPYRYAGQLIDGVARDLYQTRYVTFSDLTTYAYGVASTVGLMSMHIVGFAGSEAIPYAIKLGVALQLTNILRDVAEDWRAGRVYLPAEELAAFDLSDVDLESGVVHNRWRDFMRFQIARNRQLYAEAWPGISMLDPNGRLAIGAAARFYEAILSDIEAHDYDVFGRRAYVTAGRKLWMLPAIWWQTRNFFNKNGT